MTRIELDELNWSQKVDARIGKRQIDIDNGPEFDPTEDQIRITDIYLQIVDEVEDEERFLLIKGLLADVQSAFPLAYSFQHSPGVVAIRVKP